MLIFVLFVCCYCFSFGCGFGGVCVCVVVVVVLHDKRPFKVYHLADLLVFLKDRHVLHYYRSTYTLRTVRS